MDELEKNKNKRKIYISLLVTVMCIIGVSYAFFMLYLRQSENNSVTALSCFSTTLTEENSAINLTDEYPIPDEDGMKKTPFTFKITNNCDNYVKAYITIDPLKEGTSNYILSKYMKANVSTKDKADGTSLIIGNQNTKVLDNKDNGFIVKEVGLNSKESKEFDLRLWIDYDTTKEQAAGMTYLSQVVIVTEPGKPTLSETILANNNVEVPLTTPGKEVSAYTKDDIVDTSTISVSSTYQTYYITYGTGYEANGSKFNLTDTAVTSDTYANSYSSLVGKYLPSNRLYTAGSSTAGTMKAVNDLDSVYYVVSASQDNFVYQQITSNKNTTEALLATTEDDYGTSYYFRGAVKNNYVEFANKCWRIVRIIGDGSVKLVLHNDNMNNVENPCSSANNNSEAAFAHYDGSTYESVFNLNNNDNAYVGFMFGTAGASDYASAHANINKSEILKNLETWYKNNLTSSEDKIADTVWCNDKTNVTDTTYDPFGWSPNGLGYSTNVTYYSATKRLIRAVGTGPSLKCDGKLNKIMSKIGLLTADEFAFAGSMYGAYNRSIYLQENTGGNFWCSLSPFIYYTNAQVWAVSNGSITSGNVNINFGVRPSISLVSDSTISGGTGTSEDPYVVD